jgi:CheY-like chemotaxis protein
VSRTLLREGKGPAVPVVFITAQDDPESMKEGFRAGGTVFLAKPFTAAQLIQVVTSLTNR